MAHLVYELEVKLRMNLAKMLSAAAILWLQVCLVLSAIILSAYCHLGFDWSLYGSGISHKILLTSLLCAKYVNNR